MAIPDEAGGHMITFDAEAARFALRVAGVAIHAGRVLVHRGELDDFWALPGGRGELLEPSPETLRREMLEEIGTEVRVGRLLWVMENFFYGSSRRLHHELGLYFLMEPAAGSPVLDADELEGVEGSQRLVFRWLDLDRLDSEPLYPVFLRRGLQALPDAVTHVVWTDPEEPFDPSTAAIR